jgi:hypothetical protein
MIVRLSLAAALLLAGCGGDSDPPRLAAPTSPTVVSTATTSPMATEPVETPGDFALAAVDANLKGQYGKIWSVLHPLHQETTTRGEWESCKREEAQGRAGMKINEVEVVESYPDSYDDPAIGVVDAVAVTVRMKFEHPLLEGEQEATDTLHVLNVDGAWRGLWEPATYEAYVAGRCPD